MIILTRLGGRQLAVNPDLIDRAETTPDTVITMIDGHKLLVVESIDEVVDLVRAWRASVAAHAYTLSHAGGGPAGARAVGRGGLAAVGDPTSHDQLDRSVEMTAEDAAAHSALGSSLARVLRMPQREE